MPKPYSKDLRQKIVAAYNQGEGSMISQTIQGIIQFCI